MLYLIPTMLTTSSSYFFKFHRKSSTQCTSWIRMADEFGIPVYQSLAKDPCESPSFPTPQSQSSVMVDNQPGNGTDCNKKCDLKQEGKKQAFVSIGVQDSSGKFASLFCFISIHIFPSSPLGQAFF